MKKQDNRRKLFTIQEGHYTGPKDLEDGVPGALGTVTKTTLAGIGIGGIAGKLIEDNFKRGAKLGGKTGFVAGVLIKILLNSLHNPMNSVKYQEVDKQIRSCFGINRVSGFTFGDSRENRAKLNEAFAFNDRIISDYKILFTIQNNQVTMYTQNISDVELRMISDTLDYYCKKYYGMDYNSKSLDTRCNSYSVSITFTNYSIISDFLVELADTLKTRINILDNKAIVEDRVNQEDNDIKISSPKFFSSTKLDKYDIMKILYSGGMKIARSLSLGKSNSEISSNVMEMISDGLDKYSGNNFISMSRNGGTKKEFDNDWLLHVMKDKLRLIEGLHFTTGKNSDNGINIRLYSGTLIITANNKSKDFKYLEKIKDNFNISDFNKKVSIFTYDMKSKAELEVIINKLFNLGIVPNVYIE